MSERIFYTACASKEEMEKEWNAFPAWLTCMLKPRRFDYVGYPCAVFPVGNDFVLLDVRLVYAASDGRLEKAKKFILSEMVACCESVVFSL